MGIARVRLTRILVGLGAATAVFLSGLLGSGMAMAATGTGLPSNQVPLSFLKSIHRVNVNPIPPSLRNGQAHARFGIFNIDSVPNFNGHFMLSGFDPFGNPNKTWYTNTVGNPPEMGGTTTLGAPVFSVGVELMNVDGNGTNVLCDAKTATQQALNSPVFQNFSYTSSSTPTQWADAISRAEFYQAAKASWHTLLAPQPQPERVLQFPPGSYVYVANPDGSCAVALVDFNTFINQVFPATSTDTSTLLGAAEHSGAVTTSDITNLIMGNVLPCFGGFNNCALGFHTFDFEPGDASNGNRQRDYVVTVSSWLDQSLFGPILADASTLTHEIAEAYNDPFVAADNVHDVTPWWTDPTGSICQNNLEVGDVIEFLPNQVFPITLNGMTYHNQTEALIQWFRGVTPSDAIDGAFSYPDTTVLTKPLVSLKANCAP
jgi:hypothetical protein